MNEPWAVVINKIIHPFASAVVDKNREKQRTESRGGNELLDGGTNVNVNTADKWPPLQPSVVLIRTGPYRAGCVLLLRR